MQDKFYTPHYDFFDCPHECKGYLRFDRDRGTLAHINGLMTTIQNYDPLGPEMRDLVAKNTTWGDDIET